MKPISRISYVAAIALFAAGCGDEPEPAPSPPSVIEGDFFRTHIGNERLKYDVVFAKALRVSALTVDAAGEFTEYPATTTKPGRFAIPGVPEGPFYLQLEVKDGGGLYFIKGTERRLNVSENVLGREDAEDATSDLTALALDVDGLDPWVKGSWLELFSLNAGASGLLNIDDTDGEPKDVIAEGTTDLGGMSFRYKNLIAPNLIDASKGDEAVITQLVLQKDESASIRTARKVFRPPPFTMEDEKPTSLTGSFEDVPLDPLLQFKWSRSEFGMLTDSVHPEATVDYGDVGAYVDPTGGEITAAEPQKPSLFIASAMDTDDQNMKVTFGNPYQAQVDAAENPWSILGQAFFRYSVKIDLSPGNWATVTARIGYRAPFASFFEEGLIKPPLGPVQDIKINGNPATQSLSTVGETPTVTFGSPVKGTAKHFLVSVYESLDNGKETFLKARVYTSDTSVTIPPGVLTKGAPHFLIITAYNDGFASASKPFLYGSTSEYADAVSSAFTP